MGLRSVGAIGITVRPDGRGFNDAVHKIGKRAEDNPENKLKLQLEPDPKGFAKKLQVVHKAIQTKLDAGAVVFKIPIVGDGSETIKKMRLTLSRLNTQLKNEELIVPMTIDPKGLKQKADAAAKAASGGKVKVQTELDPDKGMIERQIHRLTRDSDLAFTPDIVLDPQQLQGLDLTLDADVEIRKGKINALRREMAELAPMKFSLDPDVNTPEVTKKWDRLVRDLAGHTIDLEYDLRRKQGAKNLLPVDVEVDTQALARTMARAARDSKLSVTPDVKLNPNQLRQLNVELDADIKVRKGEIERIQKRIRELAPAAFSVDPNVNTAGVRKEWAILIRELAAERVDLNIDVQRQINAQKLVANVDVDSNAIARSLANLARDARMVITPKINVDRDALNKEHIQLEVDVDIRKGRIQVMLDKLAKLEPKVLSVDPKINTEEVRRQWDRLKRDLGNETIDLKADLDRQAVVKSQLALLTRNRVIDLVVKLNARSLATAAAGLAALSGYNVLKNAGEGLERLILNLDKIAMSAGRTGIMMSTLSSGILSMTSSAIGLAGGLGQLGGFALVAPAIIAGLAGILTVSKMAFTGFTMAVSPEAAGSVAAMESWLIQLPKNAQAAARSLRGLYKSIQLPVQDAFWEKLGGTFEGFVNKVIPEVRTGLVELSVATGGFLAQFVQGFTQLGGSGIFSNIFHGISEGLTEASAGLQPFIEGMVSLATEGSRSFPNMGRAFADMGTQFNQWVTRVSGDGKVQEWIHNANVAASDLGNVFKETYRIFAGIGDIAKGAGGGNLSTFSDTLTRIRQTVSSGIFQDGLRNLFAGAHEAIGKVKDGLGDLGRGLYEAGPAIKEILSLSGGVINDILSGLGSALSSSSIQTGFVSLFSGIAEGVHGFMKSIDEMTEGMGKFADLLGTVFKNVLPIVGEMFGNFAETFGDLVPQLKQLVPILATFAGSVLANLFTALNVVLAPIQLLMTLFSNMPSLITNAILGLLLLNKLTKAPMVNPAAPLVNGLRQVPSAANNARAAMRSPLGAGFASASSFTPFLASLKAIPGQVTSSYRSAAAAVNAGNQEVVRSARSGLGGFGDNLRASLIRGFAPAVSEIKTGISNMKTAITGSSFAGAISSFQGALSGFPGNIGPAIRSGFAGATTAIKAGGAAAVTALKGVGTALGSAGRGLASFIGGGWGAAFAGAFAIITSLQTASRNLQTANKATAQSYKDIAAAALEAGTGITGMDAQQKSLDRLTATKDAMARTSFFGLGNNTSVRDILDSSGLSDQAFVDVMNGTGNAAGEAFLDSAIKTLQTRADRYSFSGAGPMGWIAGLIDEGDTQVAINTLADIKNAAVPTEEALDKLWATNAGHADGVVGALERIKTSAKDGKVTLANITGIRTNLDLLKIDPKDNKRMFTTALSEQMGGDTPVIERNAKIINGALNDFSKNWGKVGRDDPMPKILQGFANAEVPIGQIRQGLEGLGYTTEEAAHAIEFTWGPAADKFGKSFTVMGKEIPKLKPWLGQASDGLGEYSKALGAAAGIDPNTLLRVMRLEGTDPQALATGLATAAVGIDKIREALTAAGVTGPAFGAAMFSASEAAGKLTAATHDTAAMYEFDKALQAIRDSADDATTKAGGLLAAFDKLHGGIKQTADVQIAFSDAIRAISMETFATGAEDAASQLSILNQAMDKNTGQIDFSVKGIGAVKDSFTNLATTGIAQAITAYQNEMKASGDSVLARQRATESLSAMNAPLDAIRASLTEMNGGVAISDAAWNTMLTTMGLTPEQITTLMTADVDGAIGDIAGLVAKIDAAKPGAVIPITAPTQSALMELDALGIKVTTLPNGDVTVELNDLTPEQIAGLKAFIASGTPAQVPTAIAPPTGGTGAFQALIDKEKLRVSVTPQLGPTGGTTGAGMQGLIDAAGSPTVKVTPTADLGPFQAQLSGTAFTAPVTPTVAPGFQFSQLFGTTTTVPVTPTPAPGLDMGHIFGTPTVPVTPTAAPGTDFNFVFGTPSVPVSPTLGAEGTGPLQGQINGSGLRADVQAFTDPGTIQTTLSGTAFTATADVGGNTARLGSDIGATDMTFGILSDVGGNTARLGTDVAATDMTYQIFSDVGGNVTRLHTDVANTDMQYQIYSDVGGNTSRLDSDVSGHTPPSVTSAVQANLGPISSTISGWTPPAVHVKVIADMPNAAGNIYPGKMHFKAFDDGGFENHRAQISHTMRVWAEPETMGEAYIPLNPTKRPRSLAILSQVATEFGYTLAKIGKKAAKFDNGGTTGVTTSSEVTVIQNFPVTEKDSVALMRAGQLVAAM